MGHDHGHSHTSAVSAGAQHRRPLFIAFGLTATYMVVELVAGLATGSLALVSDAAHMGTDVLGLGMALAAITMAQRASGPQRTYGTYRLEVLAALANGFLLFAVAGYVLFEAWRRWSNPPEVPGAPMMIVAIIGLIINIISFRLLMAGAKESLNVRGAYLEVLSDMLGSVGVIVAGIILITTGWRYADPIIGVAIGLFILPRTWKLTGQALRILMEVAPPGLDVAEVEAAIGAIDGVAGVHDLHIWTVTSGLETATGHVVLDDGADLHDVLDQVGTLLAETYHVTHATIQCEPQTHEDRVTPI